MERIIAAAVRRRTATTLLTIGFALVGLIAYVWLPIAPLPQVEFPTLKVDAHLPGASAETMASSVASPLERYLATIPGVREMTSESSLGATNVVLVFDLNRNIDGAAQDVQTAINAAAGLLPKDLPSAPTYHKVNPAESAVMSVAVMSDHLPLIDVDRYAEDVVAPVLSRIPGVSLVDYHGQARPAVRVALDPDRVANMGLTLEDVRNAVNVATVDKAKGSLNGTERTTVLRATDQLTRADQYGDVVVAYRNGVPIHVRDIGTAVEAPEDTQQAAWTHNRRAIIIDIIKAPGSNVIETAKAIHAAIDKLSGSMPDAISMEIVNDRTQTIQESVIDVQKTILLTIALVVAVIFVFLRNLRATVIPSVTIPLSLLGSFALMMLLGYTLDNLSLMALAIAVGFVVDDAIVVTENISRHIEEGMGAEAASIAGTREVGFTILSMTVSLIAVFIPILFMGGITGRLFREFGVTMSIAVIMSGIVSLTVTPMMCSLFLRHADSGEDHTSHGRLGRIFEAMLGTYRKGLDAVLARPRLTLAFTGLTILASLWLYDVSPKGFFPQQDTGVITGTAKASTDIAFPAMRGRMRALVASIMQDPDVSAVESWIGPNPTMSAGRLVINLKPYGERKADATAIMDRIKKHAAGLYGITINMQVRQDINIGARISSTQFQYTLQSDDIDALNLWAGRMKTAMADDPAFKDVDSSAQAEATAATLVIDRENAARLGVDVDQIDNLLYDAFGQRQIATMYAQHNQYYVVEELDHPYQDARQAIDKLYARASAGSALVPLNMLVHIEQGGAPVLIAHQGQFPAITLSFNLPSGLALSDAVAHIHAIETRLGMPDTVTGSFSGAAQAFQESLQTQPMLILAAILCVYVILGLLYESAIHPLTILSTIPSAGLGALIALRLTGYDLSTMGMIGILLLIGIVKKNAIMMIDFAMAAERDRGLSPFDAIREACLLRFRPIMMTTFAALLGALPLALNAGAGSEIRRPMGIAIVGGLLVSQVLTLYTTPVVHLWLRRLQEQLAAVQFWLRKNADCVNKPNGKVRCIEGEAGF